MKYEIYLCFCLIFLCMGIVGIFYASDIAEKLKMKKKSSFVRVSKAAGLILATVALIVIYILGR